MPSEARAKASISQGTRLTARKFDTWTTWGGLGAGPLRGRKRSVSTKFGMTSMSQPGPVSRQKCSRVSRARDSDTAVAASLAAMRYCVSGA